MRVRPSWLALACWATASASLAAATLELRLDPAGLHGAGSFPVRSGVPFAMGALQSDANVRLLLNGTEAEVQTEVMARYGDGSVKWLLLDFVAEPNTRLILEYGKGVERVKPRSRIAVSQDDQAISVDTGRLKAAVSRDGRGLFEELYLDIDGNGKYDGDERIGSPQGSRSNFMDFIHTPAVGSWPTATRAGDGAVIDRSRVHVSRAVVEREGPLHAVVRLEGEYRYSHVGTTVEYPYTHAAYAGTRPRTSKRIPFVLRLHFYRDTGLMELQHTFVYEGDPDRDFAKSLAFVGPAPTGDGLVATVGYDKEMKAIKVGAKDIVSITQENADRCQVWRADAESAIVGTVAEGRRSSGWLDVSVRRWGVAAGVWRLWQNYPKALRATGLGAVQVFLWPPEAGPMDLRRYTRHWGVGETGARGGADPYGLSRHAARGVAKTHRVLFYFHPGDAASAKVARTMACFCQRPLAWPTPAYLCATHSRWDVASVFSPPKKGRWGELEEANRRVLDWYLFCQEHFRWYGMFSYGDLQQFFQAVHPHGRWESDFGRWGWFNGDASRYKPYQAFVVNFLRTGRRDWFDFVEAELLHIIDVDMVNAAEYPWDSGPFRDVRGCAHRHNAQHWACLFVGSRGVLSRPLAELYYLTGDERPRDVLDLLAQQAYKETTSHEGWRSGHSARRDVHNRLFCALERTGEKKYLDLIQRSPYAYVLTSYGHVLPPPDEKDDLAWVRGPADRAQADPRRGGATALAMGLRYLKEEKYRDVLEGKVIPMLMGQYRRGPYSLPRAAWPGSAAARIQNNWCPLPNEIPLVVHALGAHSQRAKEGR